MISSQGKMPATMPFAIMVAFLALIPLQIFFQVPIGENGPLDFGEQGGYLTLSVVSFVLASAVRSQSNRQAVLWASTGLAFAAALVAELPAVDSSWDTLPLAEIPAVAVWLITTLALAIGLRHPNSAPRVCIILTMGFALQSCALLADFGEGFLGPTEAGTVVMAAGEICGVASLGAYLTGLLMISPLVSASGRRSAANHTPPGEFLFDWLSTGPYRHAVIAFEIAKQTLWRLRYPGSDFAAYYAGDIVARLNRGSSHRTLGQRTWSKSLIPNCRSIWSESDFRQRGLERFLELQSFGISSTSTVVDFGCGSLRIGQHFIRYLEPGRFWGLDITDRFYIEGVKLVGSNLIAAKRPHLQVIEEETLRAVRRSRPNLIYSIAVMKHVPANELESFWRQLQSMMTEHTILAVEFQVAARNMRIGGKSWAYTEGFVRNVVRRSIPLASIRIEMMDRKGKRALAWRRARLIVVNPRPAVASEGVLHTGDRVSTERKIGWTT